MLVHRTVAVRSFTPFAFCEFGSDGSRCEEPPLPPTTGGNSRYYVFLNAIVFPFIYLFRIWLQIGPDARNNAKQADDVVQDLGTSRKPAAFDNADGPIWTVGEKGFLHHPKKVPRSGSPDEGIFSGVFNMKLCIATFYDAPCLHCHLINLEKAMKAPRAENRSDFCSEYKERGEAPRRKLPPNVGRSIVR